MEQSTQGRCRSAIFELLRELSAVVAYVCRPTLRWRDISPGVYQLYSKTRNISWTLPEKSWKQDKVLGLCLEKVVFTSVLCVRCAQRVVTVTLRWWVRQLIVTVALRLPATRPATRLTPTVNSPFDQTLTPQNVFNLSSPNSTFTIR